MPETREFDFMGHSSVLICPDKPAEGRPYVWRTEFLYAFNQVDMALLEKGWHIAYCGYSDEYGSKESISLFKKFHDFLSEEFSLSGKPSLFGFSRGALYAVNYAMAYPQDVSCLYLDAPVLDLRSWPCGMWKGLGSPAEWEDCKKRILRITDDSEAENADINPVNRLDRLAGLGIPVVLVAGDSDSYVPYEENGLRLAEAYRNKGCEISVTIKEGCDHHPHSLEDPAPVVDFVLGHFA